MQRSPLLRPLQREFEECVVGSCLSWCLTTMHIVTLERLNRCIANKFITEVEEARGPTADAVCNPKTKLVEAKLEMVSASGLFQHCAAISVVHRINIRDRL